MGKRKQFKNAAYYFGGMLISALLGMISTPLLTRILSKEVYAQYGMVMTFTTALASFIYLGQDEAFMRYFDIRKERYWSFLVRCMKYPIFICFLVCILLMEPTQTVITYVFGDDISCSASLILCLYLFALVVQRFLMLTARMEERAINYSVSNIATKGVFLIAIYTVYCLKQQVSLGWTIISLACGAFVAMIVNIYAVLKSNHTGNPHGKNIASAEMLKYGIPLAATMTMSFSIPLIERLIIRQVTDWDVLAIYTSASIFITVMNMVKTTLSNIWTPYTYKTYKNKKKFKRTFYNIGIALTFLMVCILAGTILTRRWLVIILDEDYYDTFIIAPAIVCGSCFDVLSAIYSVGIYIRKKTLNRVIIPIIHMIISFPCLYFCLPIFGLQATGIAYLLSIAISRAIEISMALYYYGTGRSNSKLFVLMGICIVAGLLSLFFTDLRFDIILSIALLIISGFVVKKELIYAVKWVLK